MKTGILTLVMALGLTACASAGDSTGDSTGDEEATAPATRLVESPATEPSESAMSADAETPAQETAVAGEGQRAIDCVPGTWRTDMPSLVSTFQTPGDPTYVSGEYVFTFDSSGGFDAVGDDVAFRLTNKDGFVEVHNSWTEDGLWAAANNDFTFDEALAIVGFPGDMSANEFAFLLEKEETQLIALVGGTYTNVESYGLVNGSMRTPPLSDEGASITAAGYVDCPAGEMSLIVGGSGWKGEFALTKEID